MEHAEDYRLPRVVVQEAQHDLVADFGAEEETAIVTRVQGSHPRPRAVVARIHKRHANPHTMLALGIFIADDHSDLQAVDARQQRGGFGRAKTIVIRQTPLDASELNVRLPSLNQIEIMTHAGNKGIPVVAITDAGQGHDVAGVHSAYALALDSAAHAAQLRPQPFRISPRLRFFFGDGDVL